MRWRAASAWAAWAASAGVGAPLAATPASGVAGAAGAGAMGGAGGGGARAGAAWAAGAGAAMDWVAGAAGVTARAGAATAGAGGAGIAGAWEAGAGSVCAWAAWLKARLRAAMDTQRREGILSSMRLSSWVFGNSSHPTVTTGRARVLSILYPSLINVRFPPARKTRKGRPDGDGIGLRRGAGPPLAQVMGPVQVDGERSPAGFFIVRNGTGPLRRTLS